MVRADAAGRIRELPHPDDARRIRIEAGLSQEALAPHVPCSTKSLGLWESGRVIPSPLMRVRYARALARLTGGVVA